MFLRECQIAEHFLSTCSPEESKREFLDRVFERLQSTDRGRGALLRMAQFLAGKRDFPDLLGWEESDRMLKEAREATGRLDAFLRAETLRAQEERETLQRHRERQAVVSRSRADLAKLSDRLSEMSTRLGTQQVGYDFEVWFFDLVDYSEIVNRRPYKHAGRQVDGSITLSGTTYLIELKFQVTQAAAPDVDSLLRKVTSKADNTMGIMVSISGFSSVAKAEASGPRTPLLLLDASHLYAVLTGTWTLGDVIDRVRRHASQTGIAYLPASELGLT